MLLPKETGEYISKLSKMVTIEEEGVETLAEKVFSELKVGKYSLATLLSHKCHPSELPPEKAVNWILVVDTLNFCFWSAEENRYWEITFRGNKYSGYFGLCFAINRAIQNGIDMTDPHVYGALKLKDLREILQGDDPRNEIPLLKERLENLHEVGAVLIEKYQGSFMNCIEDCFKSANTLLKLIVKEFGCFKDESVYKKKKVSFYKRAQILVSDVWACFEGKGPGEFKDIDDLTMFPDYRVPQVLVYFGVLKYDDELYEKLMSGEILEEGCDEELEIRGCSIEAVERIKKKVLEMLVQDEDPMTSDGSLIICNSILIDYYLWDYRRNEQKNLERIPFHKVLTIFY